MEDAMKRGWISRVSAVLFAALLGVVSVPGCVLKITTGEGTDTTGDPVGNDPGSTSSSPAAPTDEELQHLEMLLAKVDPAKLSYASALAGNTTCALVGTIEGLGLDPTTLDEATLQALAEQHLQAASDQAKTWLASVDPVELSTTFTPKFECWKTHGCVRQSTCKSGYIPPVMHTCLIAECGKAGCGTCPEFVNDLLRNVAIKSWCSYVCLEDSPTPEVVAIGAGAVSAFKDIFIGPFCVPEH
jgi:hypothetical protein